MLQYTANCGSCKCKKQNFHKIPKGAYHKDEIEREGVFFLTSKAPSVFLSPSTQEYNPYINGGNEEYYMNQIADAMEPLLDLAGIRYGRNDPERDAAYAVEQSNAGGYGLHLPIHSNAAPPQYAGLFQGPIVLYYPTSRKGQRAAEIFRDNIKQIYPNPSLPKIVPTAELYELNHTTAPAAYVEVAYHDNPQDAQWIRENILTIADNLTQSVADFFGVPYAEEDGVTQGRVRTEGGLLRVRNAPHLNADILTRLPNGEPVTILRRLPGWYLVAHRNGRGYVSGEFIELI